MKTPLLLAALVLSPALALGAAPTSTFTSMSMSMPTIGHGDGMQGDCAGGVKSPGHHQEQDGRPKHGDGCGR